MKLNPETLVVTSFKTESDPASAPVRTTDPFDPTPNTYCDDCPVGTFAC